MLFNLSLVKFIYAKSVYIGNANVKNVYVRNWVLLGYGKKIACLYSAILIIIVITIACILYIAWGCWY